MASQPENAAVLTKPAECFLHGTLLIYLRGAENLGRSVSMSQGAAQPEVSAKPSKVVKGARFMGKKLLNALRATNNVRVSLSHLSHSARKDECILTFLFFQSRHCHHAAPLFVLQSTMQAHAPHSACKQPRLHTNCGGVDGWPCLL